MKRLTFLLLGSLLGISVLPGVARADTPECEAICSINRNCSNTGIACQPDDRECTSAATAKGLEVKCEQNCAAGRKFIYCPADAGRGDSSFVWVLLALSGILAVGGGGVAYAALKKKS